MKLMWLVSGTAIGLTVLSLSLSIALGSVPSRVTNDTALYQQLSEIKLPKQQSPDFDLDISRLSKVENRYQENLPALARHPRLQAPMKRISQMKYHYTGKRVGAAAPAPKLGS